MSEFKVKHASVTPELAARFADELEVMIGEVMNGKRKADRLPVEHMIGLIQFSRCGAPALPAPPSASAEQVSPGDLMHLFECYGNACYNRLSNSSEFRQRFIDAITAPIPAPAQQPEPANGLVSPPAAAPAVTDNQALPTGGEWVIGEMSDDCDLSYLRGRLMCATLCGDPITFNHISAGVILAAIAPVNADQPRLSVPRVGGITGSKSSDLAPTPAPSGPQDERGSFESARQQGVFDNPPALCPTWLATNLREEGWMARAALAAKAPQQVLGYAMFRNGKQEGIEPSKAMADQWSYAVAVAVVAQQSFTKAAHVHIFNSYWSSAISPDGGTSYRCECGAHSDDGVSTKGEGQ